MRVAREFGLDPWAIRRTWTNRQLRTAEAWIDDDLDVPSRADHYVMQLTRELVLFMAKPETRARSRLSDFRLRTTAQRTPEQRDAERRAQESVVKGAFGAGAERRTITRTEARERTKEIRLVRDQT